MKLDSIVKVIRGIVLLRGATDNTLIGNVSDRLKVDADIGNGLPYITRTDVASSARTTSSNSGSLDALGYGMINATLDVTAVSGTNPTLDVFVEASDDGTNWSHFIQFARVTATGNQRYQGARLAGRYYRFRWVIAGTTPSFTFSITTTLKSYLARRITNKTQYGWDVSNTAAVGSTSEVFTAADSPNISIITIRATDGGSSAQFQVDASNDNSNWVSISGNVSQGSSSQIATIFSGQAFRFYRLRLTANSNVGTRVIDIHWAAGG